MISRRGALKAAFAIPMCAAASSEAKLNGKAPVLVDYGVASGAPSESSIFIWTRVPEYAQAGGDSVDVFYEMSLDPSFSRVLRDGHVQTGPQCDYTVNVQVTELEAFTTYFYRFYTQTGYKSVIGRTKTAPRPDADLSKIRFAYVSCQNYAAGYFTPFAHLALEDLDFCIHLGDHIYETNGVGANTKVIREDNIGGGVAKTLDDYRNKYKQALSDENFREVRRLFPWISLWDDHEVVNNYAVDGHFKPDPERKRVAYQAFGEYIPRNPPKDGRYYQSLSYGSLADFISLDERQYRSDLACHVPGERDLFVPTCADRLSEKRTILGFEQRDWFKNELIEKHGKWKFVLNAVPFMEIRFTEKFGSLTYDFGFDKLAQDQTGLFYGFDGWDGFAYERASLLDHVKLSGVRNLVVLTGDIHNCYAGVLRSDFAKPDSEAVGVELMTSSVTSSGFWDTTGVDFTKLIQGWFTKLNPHVKFFDMKYHGYIRALVSKEYCKFEYVAVETTWQPSSEAFVLKTLFVRDGHSNLVSRI